MSISLYDCKLWLPSIHQQKSLPALRLSLLNSQQSLIQPPQQGLKPAPCGTPPAIVAGPAVRIRHPNSVSTTTGASALPAGTLGHAAAMVCITWPSWKSIQCRHSHQCLNWELLFKTFLSKHKSLFPNITVQMKLHVIFEVKYSKYKDRS